MLSDAQRREAVYFGDKPQTNKKANCARTSTAIRNLVADAISILATLPTDTIADCVAVIGTTSRIPVARYEMERFRRRGSYWGPIHSNLRGSAHDAIRHMAHDCARDKIDPAQRRQQIIDGLTAQKITHAEIINELNVLAVAEQLETTA